MPLRLALSAQAGGATAVELGQGAEDCAALLKDSRFKLPVGVGEQAPDLVIEVACNLVVHRDLLKAIALSGKVGTFELPKDAFEFSPPFGFEPIVVVDKKSARRAEERLLNALRKVQDGWTSTYLNRHASLLMTRYLVKTDLRPNQVSVVILGIGILGAYLATRGSYEMMLLGAILFQSQSVLDGCDGEMSRVTYRGSHMGEWLDTVGDDITNYGFFLGTSIGLYRNTGSWFYLVAGAVTILCGMISSGIEYRYLIKIGSGDLLKYPLGIGKAPSTVDQKKGPIGRFLDAISPLFKRDSFVLMTLLGAALGLLGPFLFIFAAGGIGIVIAVIRAEIRMAKERRIART
jgi:phosphatidylglycerophosphate synthase